MGFMPTFLSHKKKMSRKTGEIIMVEPAATSQSHDNSYIQTTEQSAERNRKNTRMHSKLNGGTFIMLHQPAGKRGKRKVRKP
jgi:hypothetical protein